jgi:hypothetical protein
MSIIGAKKMLMDSRYPFDKVVYLKSDSFSMAGSSTNIFAYPHGLPFTPLCSGGWSTDPDFEIQYEFSSGIFPSSNPGFVFDTIFNVFADETNVYISGDNLGATMTIYFRVFAFEPSNSNALLSGIASQGDKFVIDSRLNYPKLYLNNFIDLPAGGSSDSFVYVDHNIGAIPQVLGWVTYDTYNGSSVVSAVHPVATSNGASEGVTLLVGDERIAFTVPAFIAAHRAYYRVYLDE